MNSQEKLRIINRYSSRLEKYGVHPKTLGWDKERHNLRFQILLSQWNFNEKSVLDFGCGFGDLYGYCEKEKISIKYTGVDINQDLINKGKLKYKKANLLHKDIFDSNESNQFDFAVSSGVHNFKLEDNLSFIKDTFRRLNELTTKGFAMNFISNKVDEEFKKDHVYYTDPKIILDLSYKYSRRVVLRNDYMPFEFTVFVNKQDKFDSEKVIYTDEL